MVHIRLIEGSFRDGGYLRRLCFDGRLGGKNLDGKDENQRKGDKNSEHYG